MNSRILIKIGGRAFDGEDGFRALARAIRANPEAEVIIVHGGGAEISQALKAAGRETVFVDGMRVTQAEDVQIVESVLSGAINERIAGWLSQNGVACRRMSGKTQGLLVAEPLLTRGGQSMGFVGRIVRVNPAAALDALAAGEVPVVSPISGDTGGQSYNVNADSAAAALAAAAGCTDLVFVTDVPGVLVGGTMVPSLTVAGGEEPDRGRHDHRRHGRQDGIRVRGPRRAGAPRPRDPVAGPGDAAAHRQSETDPGDELPPCMRFSASRSNPSISHAVRRIDGFESDRRRVPGLPDRRVQVFLQTLRPPFLPADGGRARGRD